MARSAKKGAYVDQNLFDRIKEAKKNGVNAPIKTWSRRSMVIPDFVGSTIMVHNGKNFIAVHVTEGMVGHLLGEFSLTRTFRMHSGQRKAGVAEKKK